MALPLFVTSNLSKLAEAEAIMGMGLSNVSVDIKEIQSLDPMAVAMDKAARAYAHVNKPLFVEDTGLFFNALNGFPGAFIKWAYDSIGTDGLCRILDAFDDRTAYVKVAVCFCDESGIKPFIGKTTGTITAKPRGPEGFGWNPIFVPDGSTRTMAELSRDSQTPLPARAEALLKLKEYLSVH